ncbi:DUF4157 domain-containing protein [Actinoplanes teichomyceticus]|uniref:eCIS core domain-containing protein n=1 Tax=Actinoplanes teichomyceticus TaxID=1867 RepID=UPI0013DDC6F1|nr:DUF4157 domain-containing protein [Actinoplanes teichomyceticus]GIF14605.1 hypothetical protein Ate01nite_46370 [Actinoplanes teichomyceticus]
MSGPGRVLALQRAIGNRAVGQLLARQVHEHGAGCTDEVAETGASDRIDEVLSGAGRPLEAPFQREMESAFQADLSGVREFRGPAAARAAAAVNASAFTIGQDIVYGSGGDNRQTRIHELTHVVKPITQVGSTVGGVGVTDPGGAGEREAEANARQIAAGRDSLVTGERAGAGTPALARAVEHATYNDGDADRQKAAKDFFDAIDAKTQDAYTFVLSVPSLGAYANLDGRTALWTRLWDDYLETGSTQGMAAAFGYVIETLVSNPTSDFSVKAGGGYSIATQVTKGGTRPDLVLVKDGGHVAWADLTASQSQGHIFAKDRWDKHVAIFAEVTYPSLLPATLLTMKGNKDNTGGLSQAELDARKAAATAKYQAMKANWINIGKDLQKSKLNSEVRATGLTKDLQELQPERLQEFITGKIRQMFSLPAGYDLPMSQVPNILAAMDVGPKTWGFWTESASVGAGEAWLTDQGIGAV